MVPVVRPLNVALFGIVCLAAGFGLSVLQLVLPIAGVFAFVGIVTLFIAYGYLAVSLIEQGGYLKYAGWALIVLPLLGQMGNANAMMGATGVVIDIVVALLVAAIVIWLLQLGLRGARWMTERYYPPLYPT